MLELNRIYNCDCLELIKELDDKSVDLILTDPPYALNSKYDLYNDTDDNLKELINKVMPEFLRVGRAVLITCGIKNITYYPQPYWILAWTYTTTNSTGKWGFTQWQPILAYGKDPYLVNRRGRQRDVINSTGLGKRNFDHPCPKPLKFWTELLLRGSVNEGDIILDPFIGSGTTAVACIRTGRQFIGMEISEEYCKIAQKRIDDELSQLKLNLG